MDWTTIIVTAITVMCASGGIFYLIVDKMFTRKLDLAEVQNRKIANGNDVADLYNKIDEIVERKTRPIQDKLDATYDRMQEMEAHYCCYREDCEMRIRSKYDARPDVDFED